MFSAIASIGLSLVAGCGVAKGPARAAVSGEVTLAGEPLNAGVIRFIPTQGANGPVVFARIRDGLYETTRANGPVVGSHRVEIDPDFEDDPAADADDPEEARAEYIRQHGPIAIAKIPERYNRKSELSAVIEPDQANSHDFDLVVTKR